MHTKEDRSGIAFCSRRLRSPKGDCSPELSIRCFRFSIRVDLCSFVVSNCFVPALAGGAEYLGE